MKKKGQVMIACFVAVMAILCLTSCSQGIDDGLVQFTVDLGDSGAKTIQPGADDYLTANKWVVAFFKLNAAEETANTLEDYVTTGGEATGTPLVTKTVNTTFSSSVSAELPKGIYDIVVYAYDDASLAAGGIAANAVVSASSTSASVTISPSLPDYLKGTFAVTVAKDAGLVDYELAVTSIGLFSLYSDSVPEVTTTSGAAAVAVDAGTYYLKVQYTLTTEGKAITREYVETVIIQNGVATSGAVMLNITGGTTISLTDNTGAPVALTELLVKKTDASGATVSAAASNGSFFTESLPYYVAATGDVLYFDLTVPAGYGTNRSILWTIQAEDGAAVTVSAGSETNLATTSALKTGLYEVLVRVTDGTGVFTTGEYRFGIDVGGLL